MTYGILDVLKVEVDTFEVLLTDHDRAFIVEQFGAYRLVEDQLAEKEKHLEEAFLNEANPSITFSREQSGSGREYISIRAEDDEANYFKRYLFSSAYGIDAIHKLRTKLRERFAEKIQDYLNDKYETEIDFNQLLKNGRRIELSDLKKRISQYQGSMPFYESLCARVRSFFQKKIVERKAKSLYYFHHCTSQTNDLRRVIGLFDNNCAELDEKITIAASSQELSKLSGRIQGFRFYKNGKAEIQFNSAKDVDDFITYYRINISKAST